MSCEDLVNLLEPTGTVTVSATTSRFVAENRFVINTKWDALVKISYLGDSFREWFLGKTEEPTQETTLHYYKLRRNSVDGPIITELGGEAKAETTLSEMFSLIERQGHGEDGVLLNSGAASIFYIRDITGSLLGVRVRWRYNSWQVRARSVEFPYRWHNAHRVFCRHA